MSLGTYIKTLRRQKRWTQSELARDITTKSMVSQLELGRARPSMRVIIQLLIRLQGDMVAAVAEDATTTEDWKQWATALLEEYQHEDALRVIECLLKHKLTHEERIEWMLKYSLAALRLRKCEQVIQVLSPLESELEEMRSPVDMLTLYHYLGCAYAYQGNPLIAYHYFDRCEQGLLALGNHPDSYLHLRTFINIGYVLMQLQKYEDAKQRFKKASTVWNQNMPVKWKGFVHHNLSVCARRLGDWKEAKSQMDEALHWYLQDSEDNQEEIIILNGERAKWLADQGKYEEAISFFETSFAQRDVLRDPGMKMDMIAKMAEFHFKAGRLEEALALLQPIFSQEPRLTPSLAYGYHIRGQIYRSMGRNKESVEDFTKAAELYQKVKCHKDMAIVLDELNEVLHDVFDKELIPCNRLTKEYPQQS